ncbi:MAG: penicillin acylase family protein [Bacteroidota bacterium]|nr:penicillin acylase family protein [Bacteroidota bacterium]
MKKIFSIALFILTLHSFAQTKEEVLKWEQQARQVNIIRDHWGIPHVYGKTDADAVFGLMYAQCEDDFNRVELNFIEKLGRMAEIKGETELANDLLIRLIIDSNEAKTDYARAEPWLKKLLNAHADGINFYLYKHPNVKPLLLIRFQPWFHLLWTDGSIGAINTSDITVNEIKELYIDKTGFGVINKKPASLPNKIPDLKKESEDEIQTGSNGFAFAASITESKNAILYINPHVTFYFRPEVHMVSEEGLNVYGAVTWGQLFVYQGFNENCGWMHTSSYTDIADTYIEKINVKDNKWYYEYERKQKPLVQKKIVLHYIRANKIESITVNTFYTPHGPVMAKRNGQYMSMKANNRSLVGLVQSWQRTRAKSFAEYKKTMQLLANTSNNTVYADVEGNIAYWHGNFIPKRDAKFDFSKPVDGSIAATEWKGLHPLEETVHLYNPTNGWLQNCNSSPFSCAGSNSPKKENYPAYMAPDGENFRGLNAVRLLAKQNSYNLEKVIAAGYDRYLSAFELMIPPLVQAFEKNSKTTDSLDAELSEAIGILKAWDFYINEQSIAATLAIEWGTRISPAISGTKISDSYDMDRVEKTKQYLARVSADELVQAFAQTIIEMKKKYGSWKILWGDINRYQRLSGDFELNYDDNKPSLPIGFTTATWGMLPAYSSKTYPGTIKRYGYAGNSFVCAVEFGKTIKAKSLLAGGESGNPNSKHFNDQAEMYRNGQFKDVLFYKTDVLKNAERNYYPGGE